MKLLAKLKSFLGGPFNGAQEGANRGPFFGLGEYHNSFMLGQTDDGWQRHLNVSDGATMVPVVNAAGSAYARAGSTCRVGHYKVLANGEHQLQEGSAIAKLLRNPNSYETFQQYIYNTITEIMFKGESLTYIVRDDRNEPSELHRVQAGSWSPYLDDETGEIFYLVNESGNRILGTRPDYAVPARDVIHFRQYTPRNPLVGESPITAAAVAIGINVALSQSQLSFFSQMRRASGILSTDEILNRDQIMQLRTSFDEQSEKLKRGGIPVLSAGLKFQPLSITSQDAELIQAQRMTIEDIARVFGVPLPILGDLSHSTLNNAETLINHWLSLGLGSLLENLERSLDKAFRFTEKDRIEFDTSPLLRSDFLARVDGLTKGIQGGLMTINEARRREGLAAVPNGDEPMVQSQMVTVTYATSQKIEPEPEPEPEPTSEPEEKPEESPEDQIKNFDGEVSRALIRQKISERIAHYAQL